jgi:hypothetical protein
MPNESSEVREFISELSHPLKAGIEDVRAILASDDGITEHIKWNAPSFCWEGEDRVTQSSRRFVGLVGRWVRAAA